MGLTAPSVPNGVLGWASPSKSLELLGLFGNLSLFTVCTNFTMSKVCELCTNSTNRSLRYVSW